MSRQKNRKLVFFICTHNSARSQMAEGIMNSLYGERYEAFSAGTDPLWVHPYAIEVMKEIGIDISHAHAKSVDEFLTKSFDYVVTVCDDAREQCPVFPNAASSIHRAFRNPSSIQGDGEETLSAFRRTRDDIKTWIAGKFGDYEQG